MKLTCRLLNRHLSHHTYFYVLVINTCTWYMAPTKKIKNGTQIQEKKGAIRYLKHRPEVAGTKTYYTCWPTLVHLCVDADWYLYIRTNRRLKSEELQDVFCKKNDNSKPRRETTRARRRPPPAESGEASKVRHGEHIAHRMVDLIST